MIPTTTYPPPLPRYDSGGYRYFFNGQEADNEVLGEGALHAFEYRMHDTRIGRVWSVDPLAGDYPYWSTYQFAGLMPTWYGELEGLEPITRPARTVRRPAIGRVQYNYARIGEVRLPSHRTTTTSTYRIETQTGYRPTISTPERQYIYNFHSPQGNDIPMSSDNIQAQKITLLLELCDAYKTMYQERINTNSGLRVSYKVRVGFADYHYQHKFDLLQLDYENQLRRVYNELPDAEMEFPSYIPQSWQQLWRDAEKTGRAMEQIGPSPQNYLDRIILYGNQKPYKTEIKTENIPEIIPAEP